MTTARGRRLLVCVTVSTLALAWCALAASPPWLHHAGHDGAAMVVRLLFLPVCHQIVSRSLHVGGEPLAVCARCAGLYAGFLAGCLAGLWITARRATPPAFPPGRLVPLAALPLAAEWALGHAGLIESTARGRAATGLIFGCVVAFYFLPAIDEMCGEIIEASRRRAAPHGRSHAAAS